MSLASERALLPEGTPPFAEYSLTCCAVALGSLHSTACLKLTLVPMMNLDPRFHTRMHMLKNATKKQNHKTTVTLEVSCPSALPEDPCSQSCVADLHRLFSLHS